MDSQTNPVKRHLLHQRVPGPRLGVDWEPRRGHWLSDIHTALARFHGHGPARFFSDSWTVQRPIKRAVMASALLHAAVMIFPWPLFDSIRPARARRINRNVQLTWYDPTPRDLPAIAPRKLQPALAKVTEWKPKIDAFHPRQTIASAPLRPNHPRQTLIQPDAPPEAPKILPQLPNIVQWAASTPDRPRLQISARDLAKLRPRQTRRVPAADLPVPDAPNMEMRAADLNIASSEALNAKPRLPMMPASVPRNGPREMGEAAMAAPELPTSGEASSENAVRSLLALSATPAPPAPDMEIPMGNTAAQFLISPEGPRPGPPPAAGASNGNGNGSSHGGESSRAGGSEGGGTGPPGVSISPSRENTAAVSGPAAPAAVLPNRPLPRPGGKSARITPGTTRVPNSEDSAPRSSGVLEGFNPAAPPETVLGAKRVYTLHVNMPNLTSITGSWVLRFAELNSYANPDAARAAGLSLDLSTPVPISKVDPRYPPALVSARVQGEVVLYAIIRKDGSVDSVQVLRSVEPQLDRNAVDALLQWKFRPADRAGTPVDLEAIITIPFRVPTSPF